MTLVSIPLMDRTGRRTLHLYGLGGMFIFSIFITISFLIKASSNLIRRCAPSPPPSLVHHSSRPVLCCAGTGRRCVGVCRKPRHTVVVVFVVRIRFSVCQFDSGFCFCSLTDDDDDGQSIRWRRWWCIASSSSAPAAATCWSREFDKLKTETAAHLRNGLYGIFIKHISIFNITYMAYLYTIHLVTIAKYLQRYLYI